MTNNIEILKLPPENWSDYKDLRLKALLEDPQAFGSNYAREFAFSDSEWQERLKKASEGKTTSTLFAKEDGQLVGMMGAKIDDDRIATIVGVFVKPEARGKGISKLLMERLLEDLNQSNINKIKLAVNEDQKTAIKLYESFGFKTIGKKNERLGDGNYYDGLLMEKDL